MIKLLVPQLGVNETSILVFISKNLDHFVKKGQLICTFESTKTSVEFLSPSDGYIKLMVKDGVYINVGDIFGILSETEHLQDTNLDNSSFHDDHDNNEVLLTEKARELVTKFKIDYSKLPKGKLLKTEDINQILVKISNESETFSYLDGIKISDNHVLFIGASSLAKLMIDSLPSEYQLLGFIDSKLPQNQTFLGYPILGNETVIPHLIKKGLKYAFICFGSTLNHTIRNNLYLRLKDLGISLINIIHRSSYVDSSVKMGEGNFVSAFVNIGPFAIIGDNNFLLDSSIISHDCILANNVYVSPGAVLAGRVSVDSNSLIGMNATCFMNVKIGKNVKILNGVNIFQDINTNSIIKQNT